MEELRFLPAGDRGLLIEFGTAIAPEINDRVHQMSALLEAHPPAGLIELVPAFSSLLAVYDPLLLSAEELKAQVQKLVPRLTDAAGSEYKRILKIPCCYGAYYGPDLGEVERLTGIPRDEIIRIHSGTDYKVYMLGFLPGFTYLGGLDPRIHAPRKETPRLKIRPGSVGIGGGQTGVYPIASPGGWQLIGSTPVEFYQPHRDNPALCQPGDYIRFVPVSIDEYYEIRRMVSNGTYQVEVIQEGCPCP